MQNFPYQQEDLQELRKYKRVDSLNFWQEDNLIMSEENRKLVAWKNMDVEVCYTKNNFPLVIFTNKKKLLKGDQLG